MPARPLLLFPVSRRASRSKPPGGGGSIRIPTLQRQWERLNPVFQQLQEAFEMRRIEIQRNAAGTNPEYVLVLETRGKVNDFVNAVRKIDGFEWMGEFDIDELEPDEDFYIEGKQEQKLGGRLYLILSNQIALGQMISLWERHHAGEQNVFTRGLAKFKDIFSHLKSIRRWGVEDRLIEAGILEAWETDLENFGEREIPFEIELWFHNDPERRRNSEQQIRQLIAEENGSILDHAVIEGIAYHSLLANLPANAIRSILATRDTALVKCDHIMVFRPTGQTAIKVGTTEALIENAQTVDSPLPNGEPVVALLDGLPLANHRLLTQRLLLEDPDNFSSDYPASERSHGTGMASLIIHGDINAPNSQSLSRPVYARPILKPNTNLPSPRPEEFPLDCLSVDLVHRALVRIFERHGDNGPVAPNIKVVNLSVGDSNFQFTNFMSPMARLLDWWSAKHNVLFIVSAGNQMQDFSLDVTPTDYAALSPENKEKLLVQSLYRSSRHRKIFSPAETINGLTVGASHTDFSTLAHLGNRIDPFLQPLPSVVSSFGSGYRRAIKPDLVFPGGKQLCRLSVRTRDPVTFEIPPHPSGPGIKLAGPGPVGDLNAVFHACGTSNACALLTHAAGHCYEILSETLIQQFAEFEEVGIDVSTFIEPRLYEAQLLKAMLVHGCRWDEAASRIADAMISPENRRQIKNIVSQWIGYGSPQIDKVQKCTQQRATVLGYGLLSDGDADVFELPLPPSLSATLEKRRLTVTLAYFSPISINTQKYRTASLWFDVNNSALTPNRQDAQWQMVRRGTVQHEIFEGEQALPINDKDCIEIKVNCRADAGKIKAPIAYGLVVSLEVAEGIDLPIYEEIQARIRPTVAVAIEQRPT